MKVLLIVNECNPQWASVPLLSYHFYDALSKLVDVTLVTHERNRHALEKVRQGRAICYIPEDRAVSFYYRQMSRHIFNRLNNWPVHHVLSYPVYAEFNQRVFNRFKRDVARGAYDIVHAFTPILPRYPYKIRKACVKTPFIIGPVNGGLPFPKNFERVAKKEAAQFNFLRYLTKILPGYKTTYQKADAVLAGSSHTLELVQKMFMISPPKLKLFFENGISPEFMGSDDAKTGRSEGSPFHLLFVGRLVPYKGADMLISALAMMDHDIERKLILTIVGDGPERSNLLKQAIRLNLEKQVRFTGWIDHSETLAYYRSADIFCFPSVREFGGAVVLEAMAAGLPCIVANHGGIAEYVTSETGFKIDPLSRKYIIGEIVQKVKVLMNSPDLYRKFSRHAMRRAENFKWGVKAEALHDIYKSLVY